MQKISMLQTADMVAKEIQPIRDMSTTLAWHFRAKWYDYNYCKVLHWCSIAIGVCRWILTQV